MARALPTFPDQPETPFRVELDGRVYQLRLTWSQRRGGWYLDVGTEAGRWIVQGRRLCANESPLAGVQDDDLPPGVLLVIGRDPYAREDLGASLLLTYIPADEVPVAVRPFDLTVT